MTEGDSLVPFPTQMDASLRTTVVDDHLLESFWRVCQAPNAAELRMVSVACEMWESEVEDWCKSAVATFQQEVMAYMLQSVRRCPERAATSTQRPKARTKQTSSAHPESGSTRWDKMTILKDQTRSLQRCRLNA